MDKCKECQYALTGDFEWCDVCKEYIPQAIPPKKKLETIKEVKVENPKYAAITGHRPNKLGGYDNKTNKKPAIKAKLFCVFSELIERGVKWFIVGGAQGVDQWAAEVVLELKAAGKDVRLAVALPFPGYDRMWPIGSQIKNRELLKRADRLAYVNENRILGYNEVIKALHHRNTFMVDKADVVVAVYDGSFGGTKKTVDYAMGKGKELIIIQP